MSGVEPSEALRATLVGHVRQEIGAIAAPDVIPVGPGVTEDALREDRRRILRKVAADGIDALGDVSTPLADPSVVRKSGSQPAGPGGSGAGPMNVAAQ